jgi:hypothetical protein
MGYDLPRDLGSDRLTFRRLLRVILPNLPRTSAFKQAIDPVGARWGHAEYLMADLYDVLSNANWQRANEGAKQPSPRPKPYPRPEAAVAEQTEQQQRIAALQAQAERARKRQQQPDGG